LPYLANMSIISYIYSKNMGNLYFFGDSYCHSNSNWVNLVSIQLKAPIANLGVAGSSVDFLIEDILNKKHLITPDDYVIVCITDQKRSFFRQNHLRQGMAHTPDDLNSISGIPTKILAAYTDYVRILLDEDQVNRNHSIQVDHLVNRILRNLKTKKIIYFNSISNTHTRYQYFHSPQEVSCDALYEIGCDYITNKYKSDIITHSVGDLHKFVSKKLLSLNHWVEDSSYHNYFFKRVNPVLDLIGASIPLDHRKNLG